jgi:DNA-binding MarR family transcriptional regulator
VVARAPDTSNLGFLLAKASQRWNERLAEGFAAAGYPEVRPSYGSVLLPLWEQDELRMGQLAERARLSKQTMTTLVRLCDRDGLVDRSPDPEDGRATVVSLTQRAVAFRAVAGEVIAGIERDVMRRLEASGRRALEAALRELMEL